jgi:hypothetical protein
LDALPAPLSTVFEEARGLRGEIARRSLDATIEWLDRESELARLGAERYKGLDRGGTPKSYLAFEVLAKGLAHAFKIGTGKGAGVTWNDVKGERGGKFLMLVEEVLEVAKLLAAKHPERQLALPNGRSALGRYLSRVTKAVKAPGV